MATSAADAESARPSTIKPIEPHTYQLKPSTSEKFKPEIVRNLVNNLLNEELQGQTYMSLLNMNDEDGNSFTDCLAEKIKNEVLNLGRFDQRYKYVCHVELVQNSGANCKILAQALWDADNDGKAEVVYKTETFAVAASVFAFYLY